MPTILNAAADLKQLYDNIAREYPSSAEGLIGADEYTDKFLVDFVKGNRSSKGLYNDPTYLGFNFMFDWYESPLFKGGLPYGDFTNLNDNDQLEQVLNREFTSDSALGWYNNNGMLVNQIYLVQFIQRLNFVNYNMPWYWQSISGLDVAINKYENFRNTPYRGGGDSILTINTLESVDLLIQGMSDLYKKSVDDAKYRREILPDNLRKFDFYVFVQDVRKFRVSSSSLTQPPKPQPHDNFKSNLPKVIIKFTGCKFVFNENATLFENISNVENEASTNTLKIKYDDLEVNTNVPWFAYDIAAATIPLDPLRQGVGNADDSIFERIAKELLKQGVEKAKQAGRRALLSAKRLVIEEIKRLILANIKLPWNNVYGGAYGALSNFANGGVGRQLASDVLGAGSNALGDNPLLSNIFGFNTNITDPTANIGSNQTIGGGPSYIDVENSNVGFPSETESYVKLNLSNIYDQ